MRYFEISVYITITFLGKILSDGENEKQNQKWKAKFSTLT